MMSEENKAFRFLWRFNAILMAVAGILVICALSFSVIEGWTMRHRSPEVPAGNYAPVPKSAEENYTYRLEAQPDIASLPHEQFFALQRWNGSPSSYGLAMDLKVTTEFSSSFYHYTDAVNLLAVDSASGASHWLFAGYSRRVADQQAIYAGGPFVPDESKAPLQPIALVIRTVDKDTNRDGQLDYKDGWSLYYYRPGDVRATKFFDANYIISMNEVDDGDFSVIYEKGKSAFAVRFHVPDFKLVSEKSLPDVPN
jgi:hypothetical protein